MLFVVCCSLVDVYYVLCVVCVVYRLLVGLLFVNGGWL